MRKLLKHGSINREPVSLHLSMELAQNYCTSRKLCPPSEGNKYEPERRRPIYNKLAPIRGYLRVSMRQWPGRKSCNRPISPDWLGSARTSKVIHHRCGWFAAHSKNGGTREEVRKWICDAQRSTLWRHHHSVFGIAMRDAPINSG